MNTKRSFFQNEIYIRGKQKDEYYGRFKAKFPVRKLGDLITQLQYGISESLSETGEGLPVLRMNNLQNGKLSLDELKYFCFNDADTQKKYLLEKGDVLFNRTNSFDLVGKVSLFDADIECSFASYLLRIKTDATRLDPRFLNFYLNSSIGVAKIRKYRTAGVSQCNINAQNLKNIPIPLPTLEFQQELLEKISCIELAEINSASRVRAARVLQKSLMDKVL